MQKKKVCTSNIQIWAQVQDKKITINEPFRSSSDTMCFYFYYCLFYFCNFTIPIFGTHFFIFIENYYIISLLNNGNIQCIRWFNTT